MITSGRPANTEPETKKKKKKKVNGRHGKVDGCQELGEEGNDPFRYVMAGEER